MFSACNCAAEYYTAIVFFTLYPNLLYLKSGIPENLNVKVDGVIVALGHDEFKKMKLEDLIGKMNSKPVLIDVRGLFDEEEAKKGFYYRGL